MKKHFILFLIPFLFSFSSYAQAISIPDENFKIVLLSDTSINTNMDAEISIEEAAHVKYLDVSNKFIKSLEGIEYFANLSDLNCSSSEIRTLDVSSNTNLLSLNCAFNLISTLVVKNNLLLTSLFAGENRIKNFDISQNAELLFVSLDRNFISSLDVSQNVNLIALACGFNELNSLDLSSNTSLEFVFANSNKIKSFSLGDNSLLLSQIDLSNNDLTSVDLSKATGLRSLSLDSNNLASLDLTSIMSLSDLKVAGNVGLSVICVNDADVFEELTVVVKDVFTSFSNCIETFITEKLSTTSINVYPNPANGFTAIQVAGGQGSYSLDLMTSSGELVQHIQTFSKIVALDVSNLSSGLYFLRAVGQDFNLTTRLLLE